MALYLGTSAHIVAKTFPFIILRLLVYGGFAILTLMYLGVLYLFGQAAASFHDNARIGVWLVGLLISFPITRFVREYILYLCKAAHIAVIAELATKGSLPKGVHQIEWGRNQVQTYFKASSALFVVDRLIAGVINGINGIMRSMGNMFSAVPGMQGLTNFLQVILRFSLSYIDEAILARSFIKPEHNVWENAKTGLVLYAQIWRDVLGTAIIIGLIAMLCVPILFVIFLIPALAMAQAYPSGQLAFIIIAAVIAIVLKKVFLDPWILTTMIITYLKNTEGLVPDTQWEDKLSSISKKFRQIKEKSLIPAV